MVIVDIRPDGERGSGKGAIPTDAYFAVEEIKDVRNTFPLSLCPLLYCRTDVKDENEWT